MKKRMVYNPPAVETVPASPDGIAPTIRMPAITLRGPYRSTRGPTIKRMKSVEHNETMFELPVLLFISVLMIKTSTMYLSARRTA